MADDTQMTIVGYLTADPELRYTPSGYPVANFTIASTPRYFDKQANEWKDAEPIFMRCSIWREAAENTSESLRKGMRVIAQGRLKARTFETKEGEKRTAWELDVEEVGPSLRKATAQVQKTAPKAQHAPQQPAQGQPPQSDPWGSQQPAQGGWEAPQQNEVPF